MECCGRVLAVARTAFGKDRTELLLSPRHGFLTLYDMDLCRKSPVYCTTVVPSPDPISTAFSAASDKGVPDYDSLNFAVKTGTA
jgi:hypothetical protein